MVYFPYDISFNPRIVERGELSPNRLKEVAIEVGNKIIERKPTPRLNKRYQDSIDMFGMRIFVTFEFQEDAVFHLVELRRASGRKIR